MAIIGHGITSIAASRKSLVAKKIDINSTPKVTDVKEKAMDVTAITGNKSPVLGINFEFETTYKPDIGTIKISGELIYAGADNKKVMKEWEKSKKLPADVDVEVKNFLLRKCLIMGVNISQEMQLPPPIVIPILKQKKEDSPGYIG